MEQKVIERNQEQCIFLIRESNIDFYLVIPNCKKVHIVLGVFLDVTVDFIKSIPKQNDKALVIPVLNRQFLEQIHNGQVQNYASLDNVLSFLINTSYQILTYNHIEVETQILLHNNADFISYNQQFVSKYQGRVQLIDLLPKEVIQPEEVISSVSVDPPVHENVLQSDVSNIMPDSMEENQEQLSPNLREAREPGFVSYVLLGVLVAVISLVFLYLVL